MKVIPDPGCMKAFLGVFLLISRPYILPLGSVFLNDLTSVTPLLLQYIRDNFPAMQSKIQPLISKYQSIIIYFFHISFFGTDRSIYAKYGRSRFVWSIKLSVTISI